MWNKEKSWLACQIFRVLANFHERKYINLGTSSCENTVETQKSDH